MSRSFKINFKEVTRLTRLGKLEEAVEAIMGSLQSSPTVPAGEGNIDAQASSATQPVALRAFQGLEALKIDGSTDAFAKLVRPRRQPSETTPSGGRFTEHLFSNQAGSRHYKTYVPRAAPGGPRPLIVMLHGCSQSPDDFATGTRMNELAEEFGFLVAYPEQSRSANASKCWNWFNRADQQRDQGEPSLIAGITRQIMIDHKVDAGCVYVAGLSAGAAAAAIMAETYPDLYCAAGIHSGLACGAARDITSAFGAMRQGVVAPRISSAGVPLIIFHGDMDTTVHPSNATSIVAAVTQGEGGAAVHTLGRSKGGADYSRTLYRDIEDRIFIENWTVHGGGHAWFGGSPAGTYTDAAGPDASREMVRFFLDNARSYS